jgi:hypothetical protein
MGVDYALACGDCKAFIDFHKWPPHEEAGKVLYAHFFPESVVPVSRFEVTEAAGCPVVRLDAAELLEGVARAAPDQSYIQRLKERLPAFVGEHGAHDLFMACDLGAEPWSWEVPAAEWTRWKEIRGYDCFCTFLPRNLVEDLNLTTWDDALRFLRTEHDWLLFEQTAAEVEAIRRAFEQNVDAAARLRLF